MIRQTFANIQNPWRLLADRFGLIRSSYTLSTRDGALFDLRGGTSDRYSLYEVAIRRDYSRFAHIREGDTVIDVGANIGVFTVLAAKLVGPKGRVIAVEPNSETWERLQRNVTLNNLSNVKLYRAAVTGVPRPVTLYPGANPLLSTIMDGVGGRPVTGTPEQVEGLSLAEILEREQLGRIDLLKMDCEGSEYEILDRADAALFSRLRQIVLEVHPIRGREPTELLTQLQSVGYAVKRYSDVLVYASRPD